MDRTDQTSTLVSACALIDKEGRVLVATRPPGKRHEGLWEFPGGKVERGESAEAALVRELREELGIETEASCLAPFSFFTDGEPSSFMLLLYVCRKWKGTAQPNEGQRLAWIGPSALLDLQMPPADRPLAAQLRDWLLGV